MPNKITLKGEVDYEKDWSENYKIAELKYNEI